MDLGKYLKGLRLKKGYTIRQVVLMTGNEVDKTTISRLERNERTLMLKAAYLLSKIYSVDFEVLTVKALGKAAKVHKLTAADKAPKKRGRQPKKK